MLRQKPTAVSTVAKPVTEKTVKELQNGKPFRYVTTGLEHPVIRTMILGLSGSV